MEYEGIVIDTSVYCSVKHKGEIKPCTCGEMPKIRINDSMWSIYCDNCKRSLSASVLPLKEWNREDG